MPTFTIQGINGGSPFSVTKGSLTPRAIEAAMAAKVHVLRQAMQGMDTLDDEDRATLRQDAQQQALIAQASALVVHALKRVDPKLRTMSQEEVLDLLSMEEFTSLVQAVAPTSDVPLDKAAGVPLPETK